MIVRKSQQSWDKAHMATLTCRVTKEKAQRFTDACQALGTNKNAVLLKAVNDTIEKAETGE